MAHSVRSNVTVLPEKNEFGHRLDPNDWHFDSESGQYFRITVRSKGRYLADRVPYERRAAKYLLADNEARGAFKGFWISLPIFLASSLFGWNAGDQGTRLALFAFLFIPSGVFFLSFSWMAALAKRDLDEAARDVGPAPIPPPGREQVRQQQVHGPGRVLNPKQAAQALRGRGVGQGQGRRTLTVPD